MGKRSKIWLTVAIVVMLGVIGWEMYPAHEPGYQGRSLRAWIKQLPAPNCNAKSISWRPAASEFPTGEQYEAIEAVRAMGTNALPFLLREIQTKDKGLKDSITEKWSQLKELCQKFLSRSRNAAPFVRSSGEETEADRHHWNAARGLNALGPLAKPAIPALTKMLNDSEAAPSAAYALSGMGPEGMSVLIQSLTNRAGNFQWSRICAVWALGQSPKNARQAVPQLVALLTDKDGTLRMAAAWTLGQIKSDPEVVVPALAENLGDSFFPSSNMMWSALSEYGVQNTRAPYLIERLDDPKLYIRIAATNALKVRYPKEAAERGIH